MGLTVIGVFSSSSASIKAIEQLIRRGIHPSDIKQVFQAGVPIGAELLTTGPPTAPNRLPPEPLMSETELADEETDPLSRIAADGSIVTVHAHTDDEAKRAARILIRNGAAEVNKRVGTYHLADVPPEAIAPNAALPD